ncbi:MAG: DnaJ C-terminal domain-containing protein [Candidatus Dormibacteria bacterium]
MASNIKDYYEILGVGRSATQDEIKRAFRAKARVLHPDTHPDDPGSEDKFRQVNEAYEVLGDPEKRKKYDALGAAWNMPGSDVPPQGSRHEFGGFRSMSPSELDELFGRDRQFSDFFYSMFGGTGQTSSRHPSPRKGHDIEGNIEITVEEACRGTTRRVSIDDGMRERTIEVQIPAGIRNGGKIRLSGQGSPGRNGGVAGNLVLTVAVMPSATFGIEGNHITTIADVPLRHMLLGGETLVPTPQGKMVTLRIPEGTQNGAKLRLRGMGWPKTRHHEAGDLIVETRVVLPAHLSAEARSVVSQYL